MLFVKFCFLLFYGKQEISEGSQVPPGEIVPGAPVLSTEPGAEAPVGKKPKKSRKRKKDDDGQPKEPKPKKPRKRPEKKPKQPKDGAVADASLTEGNENADAPSGENVVPSVPEAEIEGEAAKENVEGGADKETKEKKSKSKSPKSKDGTPKEPKKSAPKKKLPKLVAPSLKIIVLMLI